MIAAALGRDNQPDAWAAALDCYRMADADMQALGRDYSDDELDHYAGALTTAMFALLATPAPHWGALVDKLDMLAANEDLANAQTLATVASDARRLAGPDGKRGAQ